MENIAFDSHKRYTFCSVEDRRGNIVDEHRIEHNRGDIKEYLRKYTPGSPVAVETIGNWYWIVDEIEEAGMKPKLVHARKAKMMFGCINKTDKLDVRGLNRLQRTGTLPNVWIPTFSYDEDVCRVERSLRIAKARRGQHQQAKISDEVVASADPCVKAVLSGVISSPSKVA